MINKSSFILLRIEELSLWLTMKVIRTSMSRRISQILASNPQLRGLISNLNLKRFRTRNSKSLTITISYSLSKYYHRCNIYFQTNLNRCRYQVKALVHGMRAIDKILLHQLPQQAFLTPSLLVKLTQTITKVL